MRLLPFALLAAAFAAASAGALAACSSSSTSGSSSDPFVGSYTCTGNFTLTFTTPATRPAATGTTSFSSVIVDNGDGTFTSTTTNDAGSTCALKHSYSGNSSTLVSGQPCNFSGAGYSYTYTYTSGSGTLNGTTTTGNNAWTFTGTLSGDAGSLNVAGNGSGSNTCTRQ